MDFPTAGTVAGYPPPTRRSPASRPTRRAWRGSAWRWTGSRTPTCGAISVSRGWTGHRCTSCPSCSCSPGRRGAESIAGDHTLTVEPLRRLSALLGRPDEIERQLSARGTTAHAAVLAMLAMLAMLEDLDVAAYLRTAGVADDDLENVRERFVSEAP